MAACGSFNAEHVPEREVSMGVSEEETSCEAHKRVAGSSSSSLEKSSDAVLTSHVPPAVSGFVAVADVARFAQALLVCQVCKKFTTFSYKGFQSHMRKQHAGCSMPGDIAIGSRRPVTGRIKRKLFINSKKSRPHQKTVNPTVARSHLALSESCSSGASGIKCPHCIFRANKLSNLSIHIKRKHSHEVSPHKFHCAKCSLNTASRGLFQKHLLESNHFDQKCHICLEVFAEIPPYLDHLSQHYNLSPRSSMVQLNNDKTLSENAVKSLHEALQETVLIEKGASSTVSLNMENHCVDVGATSTVVSSSSPEFHSLKMKSPPSRLSKCNSLYSRSNSVCTSQVFLTLSEDADRLYTEMDTQLHSGSIPKSKSEEQVEVVCGSTPTGAEGGGLIEVLAGEDAMNVDCEATADATTQTQPNCFTQQAPTSHWTSEELMLTNTAEVDDMRMDVATNQPNSSTSISTQTQSPASSSGSPQSQTNQAISSHTTSNSNFFNTLQHNTTEQGLFRLVPVSSTANQIRGAASSDVSVTSSGGSLAAAANESSSALQQQYSCAHCDIIFRDKVLYTMHKGSHGFHDPFTCNLCGSELKDKYAFTAHFHCH